MEMQKEAKIKILVELDALLDTRLGAIAFLNPQVADSILENSASYVERKSDEFDRVDSRINLEEYKQVYKERGKKEICKFSFLTVFVDTLDIMIRDMERKASMGNPEYSLPTLDVNIYPYIFNEGEKESLIETLSELLGFNPEKINCVYEPYTGLNIDYFRTADYSLVVFYNFTTWLYESLQATGKRPDGSPATVIIAPAIFETEDSLKDTELFKLPNGKFLDPFDTTTTQLADLISLRFIDLYHFCMAGLIGENENGNNV